MKYGVSSEHKMTAEEFFERLTWERFRDKLAEALHNPHASVPQQTQCPAVMTLFRDIVQNIGETAIQKTDEPLTTENIFHLDQRLALLRILETLVGLAEEGPVYRDSPKLVGVHHRNPAITDRIQLAEEKSIPESPIMKGLGKPST